MIFLRSRGAHGAGREWVRRANKRPRADEQRPTDGE